jgi:hypothetical protein
VDLDTNQGIYRSALAFCIGSLQFQFNKKHQFGSSTIMQQFAVPMWLLDQNSKRQKPTVCVNSGTAVVFIIAEYYNTYMPTERQKISGARAAEIRKITGMLKLELNIIHLN